MNDNENIIRVVASPAKDKNTSTGLSGYKYKADTLDGHALVKASRNPMLDAARALLALGADPNATLVMHWKGGTTDAMKGNLAKCAKLSIEERDKGGISIVPYKPFDRGTLGQVREAA